MAETHTPQGAKAPATPEERPGTPKLASNYTPGGHEVDVTPNRNLMLFLAVMTLLMILSAVGIYQLFVSHTERQLTDAASVPASQLLDQQKRDESFKTTYGTVMRDGQVVAYRVPFAEAKRMVLADPARFAAAEPPPGWVHPDDAAKPKQ